MDKLHDIFAEPEKMKGHMWHADYTTIIKIKETFPTIDSKGFASDQLKHCNFAPQIRKKNRSCMKQLEVRFCSNLTIF